MRPENLILLLFMGALLFMMFSRTRKQQREAQQIQANLAVGVEVMTTSGMFATVVSLDDQVAVLETGPGQLSRWDRRAVARILTPADAVPGTGAAAGLSTDEGAGARLEHGTAEGGAGGSGSSAQDTAPPDRT